MFRAFDTAPVVLMNGERVEPATHPAFAGITATYARIREARVGRTSLLEVPETGEQLEARREESLWLAGLSAGLLTRSPDYVETMEGALGRATPWIATSSEQAATNLQNYVRWVRRASATSTFTQSSPHNNREPGLTRSTPSTSPRRPRRAFTCPGRGWWRRTPRTSTGSSSCPRRCSGGRGRLAVRVRLRGPDEPRGADDRVPADRPDRPARLPVRRGGRDDRVRGRVPAVGPGVRVRGRGRVQHAARPERCLGPRHPPRRCQNRRQGRVLRRVVAGHGVRVRPRVLPPHPGRDRHRAHRRPAPAQRAAGSRGGRAGNEFGWFQPAMDPLLAARRHFSAFASTLPRFMSRFGASGLVSLPGDGELDAHPHLARYFAGKTAGGEEKVSLYQLAHDASLSAFAARQELAE